MVWYTEDALRPGEIYYNLANASIITLEKKTTKLVQISVIKCTPNTLVYLRIQIKDPTGTRIHVTGNFNLHRLMDMLIAIEEIISREKI